MTHTRLAPLALLGSLLTAGCGVREPEQCNGSAASCARRYDQVTYAATHNAYSYAAGGPVQFIYVDWYGQGDVVGAVSTLNQLPR